MSGQDLDRSGDVASWDIRIEPDCVRISLRGSIGIGDAGRLRLALLETLGHERGAAVECGDLEHLDCAAAQVLLAFAAAMKRRALPVVWSPFPPGPHEYLSLAGLIDHFSAAAPIAGEYQT